MSRQPPEPGNGPPSLRAADGRIPGRRGRATRQRLLDATRDALGATAYRDLKVVDIARAAGTSPATFYQYFPDVESAVLVLAGDLADAGSAALRSLVEDQRWEDDPHGVALAVADGYLSLWERHRALIGVMDLAALEGDRRFRDLRTRLLRGANEALQEVVRASRDAGRVPADTDPAAVAGVLTAMLAHVAAHRRGLEEWGAGAAGLRHTMARIICWSVAAEGPPGASGDPGVGPTR